MTSGVLKTKNKKKITKQTKKIYKTILTTLTVQKLSTFYESKLDSSVYI